MHFIIVKTVINEWIAKLAYIKIFYSSYYEKSSTISYLEYLQSL